MVAGFDRFGAGFVGASDSGSRLSDWEGVHPLGITAARWRAIQGLVAAFAVGALAARLYLVSFVTVGLLVSLALAPVWLGVLRRYAGAVLLTALGVAALVTGLWLEFALSDANTVASAQIGWEFSMLLVVLTGVGLLLWARTVLGDWTTGLIFGLGLFLAIRANEGFMVSPWRFGFSVPVIVTVLGLVAGRTKRSTEVILCLLLAAVSGLSGSRSRTAVLVIVVAFLIWQALRRGKSSRTTAIWSAVVLAVSAVAVYQYGETLALDGLLGAEAQSRTELQIDQSGSLILGGRPEMGATWALFQHRPWGFGLGVLANSHELAIAKAGMAALGYDPNNGYVEQYMFGSGVELHSSMADMWAWFGIPGLLLGLTIIAVVVSRTIVLVAERRASALVLFGSLTVLWDMLFSPLLTSVPILTMTLGMLLRDRREGVSAPPRAMPGPGAM